MVSRLSATLVLLWAVLAALAVLPVCAIVYAQLNCQTRSCVEVRYKAKDLDKGDTRNIYCVRTEVKNGEHFGYAFSTIHAVENCYGQNSVGGKATDFQQGHKWEVKCDPDCTEIPDNSLCSGAVLDYLSDAMPVELPTKCKVGLDPQPDPGDPGP
ncbi:MAG: hypothetical protein KatS3mg109_2353 [Pirellulaceae bacterium]|nr:MAG: hypothetical protein KatS3mg109_2353 [Pirellulaceae bacterium]